MYLQSDCFVVVYTLTPKEAAISENPQFVIVKAFYPLLLGVSSLSPFVNILIYSSDSSAYIFILFRMFHTRGCIISTSMRYGDQLIADLPRY